jgi:flagellar biosynthesis/type III secretory pathway ATPase
VPKKKLTLSVDAAVIERAKRFSRRNATTVSKLVTEFLASLEDGDEPATPIVDRLRGILPQTASRDEYREHLEEKHR